MNKISCDICLDLIPLVKDDIASEDSKEVVNEHIKECDICKSLYEEMSIQRIEMNDRRVVSKIRNRLYFAAISTIFLGAILGLALTEGMGMFYNVLIMPVIGGIGYFALSKKSYYVPLTLFGFSYIWLLVKYIFEGMFSTNFHVSGLLLPAYWSLIYSGLSILGIIIAFLLKIAFKKEAKNEENY